VARRYVNPAKSVAQVTEKTLAEAQSRLDEARGHLRDVEGMDPAAPGWDAEWATAAGAVRGAERRLEALTSLRAAQLERSGKRDATVKAAAKDLAAIAAGLGASRDQVGAAAADHLRALAAVKAAVDAHNDLLTGSRAQLAALGLAVRDDLVDVEASQEHAEGTLDGGGLRAGGVNWTPIPAPGLVAHALVTTFGRFRGPFASMRFMWPAYQTTTRPDGLQLPSLEDTDAA
jgi:hypothetical protein